MGEILTSYTSLPNLHPVLVHFPIALLPVAILFDLLGLVIQTQRVWLDRAATGLCALAGLGVAAAFWAGNRAADSLVGLSPQKQILVGEHHDAALLAFWVVGVSAIVRVGMGIGIKPGKNQLLRAILLLVAVAGSALVFEAADRGGGLVFQHGIAVMPVEGHTDSAAVATAPDLIVPPPEDADSSFESRLIASTGGEEEVMAEGKAALGSGTLRLAAFAAGRPSNLAAVGSCWTARAWSGFCP